MSRPLSSQSLAFKSRFTAINSDISHQTQTKYWNGKTDNLVGVGKGSSRRTLICY